MAEMMLLNCGSPMLDTAFEVADVAHKLATQSYEAYRARNIPRVEWDEYEEAVFLLWLELDRALKAHDESYKEKV